jgi:hypothetical protein
MLAKVEQVSVVGPFALDVRFSDGSGGVHDFGTLVATGGELVAPLRDQAFFERVFLEFGALTWPNSFDIAPEWLRREMIVAGELKQNAAAE